MDGPASVERTWRLLHKQASMGDLGMPQLSEPGGDPLEEAVALARDVAPDIDTVLFTHYPDPETLDTLRPGGMDLETVVAVQRAAATEFAAAGVEILVQKASRAAFRRWMQARGDAEEARLGWIDRAGLLRGAAAHRLLGIAAAPEPGRPNFGKAPGPTAQRLLAAYDEEEEEFEDLAQSLLEAGRADVLDLALRKTAEAGGAEAAEALEAELLALAEAGHVGPSGWAELVALPVALQLDALPDAASLGDSLIGSGIMAESAEIRFLPGWRSPDALAELTPLALRRVLLDLVAGAEPRDLPPGDTDELRQRGFGVLLGLRIDWAIPIWDQIAALGGLPEDASEDEEDGPEASRRAALFDQWRAAVFETTGSCVPLAVVPPSEVGAEIADFLEEAEGHASGITEIEDFVAMGRQEAGSEDVVCRAEIIGEDLELALYTERGRFLDSLTMEAARLPASAEEMPRIIASFVRVVKDAPGR